MVWAGVPYIVDDTKESIRRQDNLRVPSMGAGVAVGFSKGLK